MRDKRTIRLSFDMQMRIYILIMQVSGAAVSVNGLPGDIGYAVTSYASLYLASPRPNGE